MDFNLSLLVSLVIAVCSLSGLWLLSTGKEQVRYQLLNRITWLLLGLTYILNLLAFSVVDF